MNHKERISNGSMYYKVPKIPIQFQEYNIPLARG